MKKIDNTYLHVLKIWIWFSCFKGELVLVHMNGIWDLATGRQLPKDQTTGIHINPEKGIPREIYGSFQNLGRHVSQCADLSQKYNFPRGTFASVLCRTQMRCHSLVFTRWLCRPPRPRPTLVTATIIASERGLFCAPIHFHIVFLTSPCSSAWV